MPEWARHEEMRQSILSASSSLWETDPEVATVLFFSWPSGDPLVVAARNSILASEIFEVNPTSIEFLAPEVVHVEEHALYPPLAVNEVYVGNGVHGVRVLCGLTMGNSFRQCRRQSWRPEVPGKFS